jgi:dynein assembly factor 1, axonemal
MPKLKVLYMQNNEVAKGKLIPSYRKTTISKIKTLTYLDDRPVFEEDRRHAEAYTRGGIEEERAERELIRKERDEKHERQHTAFKEMMRKAREEKRAADEAKARADAESKGEPWQAPVPAGETIT